MNKRKTINTREKSTASGPRIELESGEYRLHPHSPPIRHFFQDASLARSLERAIAHKDSLLFPKSARSIPPAELRGVFGEIIAENNYALEVAFEFRGTARRSNRHGLV